MAVNSLLYLLLTTGLTTSPDGSVTTEGPYDAAQWHERTTKWPGYGEEPIDATIRWRQQTRYNTEYPSHQYTAPPVTEQIDPDETISAEGYPYGPGEILNAGGCPSQIECTRNCKRKGFKYGLCSGPGKRICTCYRHWGAEDSNIPTIDPVNVWPAENYPRVDPDETISAEGYPYGPGVNAGGCPSQIECTRNCKRKGFKYGLCSGPDKRNCHCYRHWGAEDSNIPTEPQHEAERWELATEEPVDETERPVIWTEMKGKRKCPPREHYSKCHKNCEKTCSDYMKPKPCPRSCKKGCVCDGGLVRNKEGKCVPRDQCPKKLMAEVFESHGCPDDILCEVYCITEAGKNSGRCEGKTCKCFGK